MMPNVKTSIVVMLLSWAIVVPLCGAASEKPISGRELLRAMRRGDRRSERPARADRAARRMPQTNRRKGDGSRPTAMELLDKYAETQDKLRSFIIKSTVLLEKKTTPGKGGKAIFKNELRCDGERVCLRSHYTNIKGSFYRSDTYDGYNYVLFKHGNFWMCRGDDARRRAHECIRISCCGEEVRGYFYGDMLDDGKRVDSVLRKAKTISVRDRMELVGRSECYVIDAVSKRGKYTLWIDPEHGHNIAKAEVFRGPRECVATIGERAKGMTRSMYCSIRNVRFKRIEDVWVPVEADTQRRSENTAGSVVLQKVHLKRTEVILDPDHEALRSFYPDDIQPDEVEIFGIGWTGDPPERAGVPDLEFEDAWDFRWQPKAKYVVDERLKLVRNDPKKQMPTLVKIVKLMHFVGDFKPEPPVTKAKGKHIFLCFWDINQEQSQQLLLALRDRQEALAQKGVLLIAVEASGAQTDKVRSWARENELTFPVGAFYSRFERHWKARKKDLDDRKKETVLSNLMADLKTLWTVEKVPWLMLTDREFVVTAEGFSLEELGDKIKESESL
ncbi:MAG: hypothetical protein ACYTEL_06665 [Planctomycetota bacterium]|jgi:hypothetical protein